MVYLARVKITSNWFWCKVLTRKVSTHPTTTFTKFIFVLQRYAFDKVCYWCTTNRLFTTRMFRRCSVMVNISNYMGSPTPCVRHWLSIRIEFCETQIGSRLSWGFWVSFSVSIQRQNTFWCLPSSKSLKNERWNQSRSWDFCLIFVSDSDRLRPPESVSTWSNYESRTRIEATNRVVISKNKAWLSSLLGNSLQGFETWCAWIYMVTFVWPSM